MIQLSLRRLHYFAFVPAMHLVWIIGLQHADALWAVALGLLLYYPLHSLGTMIGYHKLLSHRAFEPRSGVMFGSCLLNMLLLSGHPLAWAATHRLHHKYADTDLDPHSPGHGRLHAYYTWLWSYHMPEADKFIIKDLVKEYPWMTKLWMYETLIPAIFYALMFAIDATLGCALLLAALLSWHKGMLINAISHDPTIPGSNKATNRVWLARILSPTFMHRDHHDISNKSDYSTPEVKDHSAWFIDHLLKKSG